MLPSPVSLVVAGGGPAGLMAAITAAEAGVREVVVLESTPEPLHKVLISGGGRCNVTHACWDPAALVGHYPRGGRALRGPFSRFAAADTVAWFACRGLELVEEPDGRMFPRSGRSRSVVDLLQQSAAAAGVRLLTGVPLRRVRPLPGGAFRLELGGDRSGGAGSIESRALVLATGSHPSGRRLAASLGHRLLPPVPSLFTLALADPPLTALAGVSMDPVTLELLPPPGVPGRARRQRGAVLITHWGLSGPATLRLTAFAARDLRSWGYRGLLRVDWTGGRPLQELEQRFAQARREQGRRRLQNWRPWPELSRRLWRTQLLQEGIDADLRWADLPAPRQRRLIDRLRRGTSSIRGRGPFGEEFVTAGGVPLGEVDLARMESRLQPGLFLVGELLDVDGVTGGFNFQHCWTSGWLAGRALAADLAAGGELR